MIFHRIQRNLAHPTMCSTNRLFVSIASSLSFIIYSRRFDFIVKNVIKLLLFLEPFSQFRCLLCFPTSSMIFFVHNFPNDFLTENVTALKVLCEKQEESGCCCQWAVKKTMISWSEKNFHHKHSAGGCGILEPRVDGDNRSDHLLS